MKTYTKQEVFELTSSLIDDNLLIADDKTKSNDYLIGMLDANMRIIELQKKLLNNQL